MTAPFSVQLDRQLQFCISIAVEQLATYLAIMSFRKLDCMVCSRQLQSVKDTLQVKVKIQLATLASQQDTYLERMQVLPCQSTILENQEDCVSCNQSRNSCDHNKTKLFENTYVPIFPQFIVKMKVNSIGLGGGGGEDRSINMCMLWVDSLPFPTTNQQYIYTNQWNQWNNPHSIQTYLFLFCCSQFCSLVVLLLLLFGVVKDMFKNIRHN